MKRIIVALLCAMQMTCIGMNQEELNNTYLKLFEGLTQNHTSQIKVQEQLVALQECKVKALELLALSSAKKVCEGSNSDVCKLVRSKFDKLANDI